MAFAVVRFINESNTDEEIVSEVPVGWLSEDKQTCKWPSANSHIYISKNKPAQLDWQDYPVVVENIFDSLSEARQSVKSISSEDEARGRGFRAHKPTKIFSPGSTVMRNNSKVNDVLTVVSEMPSVLEDGFANYFLNKLPTASEGENSSISAGSTSDRIQTTFETPADSPGIYFVETNNNLDKSTQTDFVLPDRDFKNFMDLVLAQLVEQSLCLQELKQKLNSKEDETAIIENEFQFELPCDSLEKLQSLDDFLKKDRYRQSFMKLLRNIGGSDGRDFTNRIMKSIFTNSLGEMCSWTGQKDNFMVKDLRIIDTLFSVINKKTNCSKKDFENYVKEWFRHSKQRREREEKKK